MSCVLVVSECSLDNSLLCTLWVFPYNTEIHPLLNWNMEAFSVVLIQATALLQRGRGSLLRLVDSVGEAT